MPFTRRDVLGSAGTLSLAGLSGCSGLAGRISGCGPACVAFSLERSEDSRPTLDIDHAGGRDLPANEVYVSGVAFDWPPARGQGFTYSWDSLGALDPTDGIAGESLTVHPALVERVRVTWRHDGEIRKLGEIRVADCDADVACFEHVHRGADDNPDNLIVRHVGGRDLPANEVYLTGIAAEYPPESETGQTTAWHELGDLTRTDTIAGHSLSVEVVLVESVRVLWRHDGRESVLERFQLYD